MASSSRPNHKSHGMTGLNLFKKEWFKERNKTGQFLPEMNKDALKAWKALSKAEAEKYRKEAEKSRPLKKAARAKEKLPTRCSPHKFTLLAELVRRKDELKVWTENIGFAHLCCLNSVKLPHNLLAVILGGYDPPTQEFRIRGVTYKISVDDVKELLRVPCEGKPVGWEVDEDDAAYKRLKYKFYRMKFENIIGLIEKVKDGKEFHLLFMIYTLGTLLCPTASPIVSEHLLKVVHFTQEGFNQYNWASYMLYELHQELAHYTKHLKEQKNHSCYVGGCLYLVLVCY